MFNFAAFAALLSLAAIPAVKGVDHQVTVGGTGIIAYNPNQVVRDRALSHRVMRNLLACSDRRLIRAIPLLSRLCKRTIPSPNQHSQPLVKPWPADSTPDCEKAVSCLCLSKVLILPASTASRSQTTTLLALSQLPSLPYRTPALSGCTANRQVIANKAWSLPVRSIDQYCLPDYTLTPHF